MRLPMLLRIKSLTGAEVQPGTSAVLGNSQYSIGSFLNNFSRKLCHTTRLGTIYECSDHGCVLFLYVPPPGGSFCKECVVMHGNPLAPKKLPRVY